MKATQVLGPLMMLAAVQANADILTFDGDICSGGNACGNGLFIDDSYGDVAGVIDVHYLNLESPAEHNLKFWFEDYNDLNNVAWTGSGDVSSRGEIFLQPLNGAGVTLHGFDLGAWPDTQRGSSFTILDGASNTLFSSGPITVGDPTGLQHNHYALNLFSADGIRIQWGPTAFNVGIDNIDFSVTAVPVPAAIWLMGPVLGGLGMIRRRAA